MNTLERIKQFIDFKGLTNQKFEKEVGFSNGAFASQLKNKRTIGVDKLENILKRFADINPEWLLTGKGEMLKAERGQTVSAPCSDTDKIESLERLLVEKDKLIAAKDETIALLKKMLDK